MNAHATDDFDLFNPYPHSAGHRGVDTSIEAAASLADKLGNLQRLVLSAIGSAQAHGGTCEELAARLDIDRGSIQPRTSELRLKGLISDSGLRRRNENGKRAIVWTLPEFVLPLADVR